LILYYYLFAFIIRKVYIMKLKVGMNVNTPLGCGEIIGIDLPGSKAWRWIVLMKDGSKKAFFSKDMRRVENDEK